MFPSEIAYQPNYARGKIHPVFWALAPEVDHVLARSRGGANDLGNLASLHTPMIQRPGRGYLTCWRQLRLCSGGARQSIEDEVGAVGAGALKRLTTEAVNEFLADHRARLTTLTAEDAEAALREGNERAQDIAADRLMEL